MQTGYIKYTNGVGGEIAVDGGGVTRFRWSDSSLDPSAVGHAVRVEFFIRESNGRNQAVRVRLQSERCPRGY